MNKLKSKIEKLEVFTMASGNLSLILTENMNWDKFPDFAEEFVKLLGGKIISRSDAVDIRVWEVMIDNSIFWLSYDDFPSEVSLESKDKESSDKIIKIRDIVLACL
jgi:hypothetical protein